MQDDNKNAGQLPDVYRLKEHAAFGYLPAERPEICRTFIGRKNTQLSDICRQSSQKSAGRLLTEIGAATGNLPDVCSQGDQAAARFLAGRTNGI